MEKRKINNVSGITLIALVVTIIVLLILAGISIQMLTGDNGILNRGVQSKEKSEIAQIIEEAKLDILAKQSENLGEIRENELSDILLKYGTLSEDEENILDKTLTTTNGIYEIPVIEIYNGVVKPAELKAGLYNAENDELIYSWDELLQLEPGNRIIKVVDGALSRDEWVIPEGINSVKLVITDDGSVTSIASGAFASCSNLAGGLVIPNGVTSIGDGAFYSCTGFTENLVIPNSVTYIGNSAFSGCSGFTGKLVIPNSVTYIGSSTFYGCSGFTGELVIPNSVTYIGGSTFYGCNGFTGDLVIPNSVTTIVGGSFVNCSGLNGVLKIDMVNIPSGFYSSNFSGTNFQSLEIGNSVTTIDSYAFSGSNFTGELVIPSSVRTIGNYAFNNCKGFTELTILNGVTTIGEGAFKGCSGFTSYLIIPNSVTTIGDSAFEGCVNFTAPVTIKNSPGNVSRGLNAFLAVPGAAAGWIVFDPPEENTP